MPAVISVAVAVGIVTVCATHALDSTLTCLYSKRPNVVFPKSHHHAPLGGALVGSVEEGSNCDVLTSALITYALFAAPKYE